MSDKRKATAIEAIKAYPWYLLYKLGLRGMRLRFTKRRVRVRIGLEVDGMTFSNWVYIQGHRRMLPWESRYPNWARSMGGSCGVRIPRPDGPRCQVSGLGHPGPHRRNPALNGEELPVVATGWGRAGNAA